MVVGFSRDGGCCYGAPGQTERRVLTCGPLIQRDLTRFHTGKDLLYMSIYHNKRKRSKRGVLFFLPTV